ncbi:hypothetical protein ACFQDG_13465 [Natronoarchaeum mannanilyticum]|uniref:Uncharacterized protein n=1 Tax=Natronoarchaeum mannanilyticum TaxID=926360 RepID=A0AAV3T4G4_9EURY
MDWIGGETTLVNLAVPVLGVISLLLIRAYANPHRSWYYFLASFLCWFAFQLTIGVYAGSLVPIPRLVGLTAAVLLLGGFMTFFGLALLSVWRDRRNGVSGRIH